MSKKILIDQENTNLIILDSLFSVLEKDYENDFKKLAFFLEEIKEFIPFIEDIEIEERKAISKKIKRLKKALNGIKTESLYLTLRD